MIHGIVLLTSYSIDPGSCCLTSYETVLIAMSNFFPVHPPTPPHYLSLSHVHAHTFHRWLSAKKGECGTSINLKVVPQQLNKKTAHNHPTRFITTPSSVQHNNQASQHTSPSLHYPKLSGIPSQNANHLNNKGVATLKQKDSNTPVSSEVGHTNATERDADNERGIDDYDGDEFESDSGSEVDVEGEGDSRGGGGGGERSDVEADRHDVLFSDSQEMDSSITNEYLRQLRYVVIGYF